MKKFLKLSFWLLVLYGVLGFFLFPFILKSQLLPSFNTQLNGKISVASVSFNPFLWKLHLSGVTLKDTNKTTILAWKEFVVNVEPHALLAGVIKVKNIHIEKPQIWLIRQKDGSFNVQHLLKVAQKPQKSTRNTQLPHIVLQNFQLHEGAVYFSDATRKHPFSVALHRIGLRVGNIDTAKKEHSDAFVRFYATLDDGGFVDIQTKITALAPFLAHGSVDFEASKLYTQWRYFQDILKLEVADGKLSLHTNFYVDTKEKNATHLENFTLALEHLRIKPKAKHHDIFVLQKLSVLGGRVSPYTQKLSIEKIFLNGCNVEVKRDANGTIDWQTYLVNEKQKPTNIQENNTTRNPWQLRVAKLAWQDVAVSFEDNAIYPHVTHKLHDFHGEMQHISSQKDKPFDVLLTANFNQHASCEFTGSVTQKPLLISNVLSCQNIDLMHYKPYIDAAADKNLRVYDVDLQRGVINFSSAMNISHEQKGYFAHLRDTNVSVKSLSLQTKSTHEKLFTLKQFSLSDAEIMTKKREITIESILFDKLALYMQRYKDKTLNLQKLIVPKKVSKSASKTNTQQQPYHIHLNYFRVRNSKLAVKDKAVKPYAIQLLDKIAVDVKNIDSNKGSWLQYKSSMRLNHTGNLQTQGSLSHTPLEQKGSFILQKFALDALNPYVQQQAFMRIDDGSLSFRAQTHYKHATHQPDLELHGALALHSLFVSNTQRNEPLFSIVTLDMNPLTFELNPSKLYINTVKINSFYLNAKIDENKTLNFAQLIKKQPPQEPKKKSSQTQAPMAVTISKVSIHNGSAEFRDFSIPIKFHTSIHDLNGAVYAIANQPQESSYIDIKGEVDKYGSTYLKGSVDLLNPKAYTDLNFDFKNLDLSSMSGYSASFAGYTIDSGKLFLDLGYKIDKGKLEGSNNILIKKIKLGKEIEDENVSHLPLGFVIGLLEDNEGIIDIDMPVEGDVNKPHFKYGALVMNTLKNLITKAVTSPFTFLASMLGLEGEALDSIVFEYGKSFITPPQREKLDKLAKMMRKRPKLLLRVVPAYHAQKDGFELKKAKLIQKYLQQGESSLPLEAILLEHKSQEYLNTLAAKLHKTYTKEDAFKRAYKKALLKEAIAMQPLTTEELQTLGMQRAQAVVAYLTQQKHLAKQRFSIAKKTEVSKNKEGVAIKMDINVADIK